MQFALTAALTRTMQLLGEGKFQVKMRGGTIAGLTVETSMERMKPVEPEEAQDDDDDDDWLVKEIAAQAGQTSAQPVHDDSASWLADAIKNREALQQSPGRDSKPTLASLGGYQGAQGGAAGLPLKPLDTSFFGKLRREGRLSVLGEKRGGVRVKDAFEYKAKKKALEDASKGNRAASSKETSK